MTPTKCPECGQAYRKYWPNGDPILEPNEMSAIRIWGYSLDEARDAIIFARNFGWKTTEEANEGKL